MTEIVVISHGNLASELVKVVSDITDRPAKAIPVCLEFHRDQAEYTRLITDILNRLDPNGQVIILTDLFGGTPSNITFPFVKEDKVEVITGMNLPILMYLEMNAEAKSFRELCEGASKAGKDAIIIAGQFMT